MLASKEAGRAPRPFQPVWKAAFVIKAVGMEGIKGGLAPPLQATAARDDATIMQRHAIRKIKVK